MNYVAQINGNKKIIRTNDGSFTFYSINYQESYKTKSVGAYTESLHKFINGSNIVERLKYSDIHLLDICFGTGLNIATTIDKVFENNCKNKLHIVSVELDYSLLNLVNNMQILFPYNGYNILRQCLKNGYYKNISLDLHIRNAVDFIVALNGKFDVIYFDPFSKKHNPEMWTEDIFSKLYSLLNNNGCLVTYASSKTIKNSFKNVGFNLVEINSIGSRYQPSMRAEK